MTSTCPGRGARCRRSGSRPASWSCTTRSGSRCAKRSSARTPAPRQLPHRDSRKRRRRTVMSAVPVNRNSSPAAPAAIGDLASAEETAVAADVRNSSRRRKTLLWAARIATLVIIVGGWQLLANAKIIDPFFWGKPSGIVTQLKDWVQQGTAYGSIWLQIWTTFKEAVLGFVVGVVAG